MRHHPAIAIAVAVAVLASTAGTRAAIDCRTPLFAADYAGPEDIELDTRTPGGPRLLVSVQERRDVDKHDTYLHEGHILSIPVSGPERGRATVLPLAGRDERAPFHPHGLSLVQTAAESLLYVINHDIGRRGIVEVFAVERDRLVARPALPADERLARPNDLVALPDGDVYVTNLATGALILTDGNVVRYHAGRWQTVVKDVGAANGITASPDGILLYVASGTSGRIRVFDIDSAPDRLHERAKLSLKVGTGLDNLTWEDHGRTLLVARHRDPLAFGRHGKHADAHAPSLILRVPVDKSAVTTMYENSGEQINAASVAVRWIDDLYIGQVFNNGVLACTIGTGMK